MLTFVFYAMSHMQQLASELLVLQELMLSLVIFMAVIMLA